MADTAEAGAHKPTVNPNLRVYDSREVAEHYAGLNYLSACERAIFNAHLRPGMDILDLGVGGGRTTAYLSSISRRYVGVDYAPEMVAACRAKFRKIDFRIADATDLSLFADGSFDAVVFAFNGIDYILPDRNRRKCLEECRRVLRSGGILVFSTHNPRAVLVRPLWDQERVRQFAKQIAGTNGVLLGLVTAAATCAKAAITLFRAAGATARRSLQRIPRTMFWSGEGWRRDSAHGGLTSHYATPARVILEVEQCGFKLQEVLGDDYPRVSRPFVTDWYYYVFAERDETGQISPCA